MRWTIITLITGPIFMISACGQKSGHEKANGVAGLNQKELQYYTNGKQLYTTLCANCHHEEGNGFGRLIPPLRSSDYLLEDPGRAALVIKYGQRGPVVVNGVEYNQPMPANPRLTPLEIAEILTYIGNAWGNELGGITSEEVKNVLDSAGQN